MNLRLLIFFLVLTTVNVSIAQIANQPPDIRVCEDVDYQFQLDGYEYFDLTIYESIITQGNTTSVRVTYHEDFAAAQNSIVIEPPENFLSFSRVIYVRVEELSSGNFEITSFNIEVLIPPFISDSERIVCDDEVADGITTFSTSELNSPGDFYWTESDALNEVNPIPQTFQNNVPYYDRVYGRFNSGPCYDIFTVYLEVNSYPVITNPTPYEICEPNSDGTALFFLESKIPELSSGSDWGISYIRFYATLAEAQNGVFSERLPSEYENITNPQTVYFRAGNNCSVIGELELVVNDAAIPQINTLPAQSFCPTEVGPMDLTLYENQLVNDLNGLSFSYYDSLLELLSETNEIIDPTMVEFDYDPREIFIRVDDDTSDCYAYTGLNFNFNAPCEIVCGDPFNFSFCQSANDITYLFTSEDGSPLTLEINEGTLFTFSNLGYFIVKDSDGTELYNGSGTPTETLHVSDLSGLIFQSSGSTMAFEFYSAIDRCNSDPEIYIPIDIDVYCSQNIGLLKLSAFLDTNSNGVFDADESNYTQGTFSYEMNISGDITEVSSSTGEVTLVVEDTNAFYMLFYDLYTDYENCYDVAAGDYNVSGVAAGTTVMIDFPILQNSNCEEDLAVYLLNDTASPRPGFSHENRIVLKNLGSLPVTSGTLAFTHDSQLIFNGVTSVNSNYTITNTATGFTLDFINLQAGDVEDVEISLLCPSNIELGEIVTNSALYVTDNNDVFAENNSSVLSETVVGSYDPNDKMETHGPQINHDDFTISDEYLYYTIRFQNIGSADALFVRIEDVLDDQLDAATFQMLRSSHDYLVTRNHNNLKWVFNNINLPAEQDDAEGSQGFVYFKIKPQAGYAVGDVIPNPAAIFFDFNAPIITNVFETEFVLENLSVEETSFNMFDMFPNPAKDKVTIKMNASQVRNASINILDLQGKLILKQAFFETNTFDVKTAGLKSGIYFVKLKTDIRVSVRKLIIN